MDLSVVIVSYNAKYFLEQCIHAVLRAGAGIKMEVLIIDNHSSDGSVDYLRPRFPSIRFIALDINIGFAAANNQAIQEANGTFVLFLNPDTIVPEDCFITCIQYFQNHKDCGALGLRMIDGAGKFLPESKRCFPRPSAAFYKLSGMSRLFPASRFFSSYYAVHPGEQESGVGDVLSGAFLMTRHKILSEVGGFDTDYFMYGEDIDLSYRIQKSGYNNHYLGSCTIIHFKGESTQKGSSSYIQNFYGAMSLFVRKHYTGIEAGLMLVAIATGKMVAQLNSFFNVRKSALLNEMDGDAIFYGTPLQTEDDIKLLNKSSCNFKIIRKIDTAAPGISELSLLPSDSIIILHENPMTFKAIIESIQHKPRGAVVLIRASGSNSLVGSSDRNEKGIFIAG